MPLLYDTGMVLYRLGIHLAAPFVPKARAWVEGRKAGRQRLPSCAEALQGCLWMHCASVGEFEQGRPVLEAIKAARPGLPVLLTFFSPSGYEAFKDHPLATHVDYLPADTSRNARSWTALLRPRCAIFIKYEFWYHHLQALHAEGVPTYLVSGTFRPDQPFFHWYGRTWRRMLGAYDHIFTQDERSAELLARIGIHHVTVSGDTRFDRVGAIVAADPQIPLAQAYRQASELPLLMAGSTWSPDDDLLAEALRMLRRPVRTVLVPHEPVPAHLDRTTSRFSGPVVRWSALERELARSSPRTKPPHEPPDQDPLFARTLVVDRTGLLARLYRYADITYVGGGFTDGIHSILEPAAWGRPVIFGPHNRKFPEAAGLIEAGGGFEVRDSRGLAEVLQRLLGDAHALERASLAAGLFVRERMGATRRVVDAILPRTE
ncbi:MAG: 3-deoxy-D-manno-octulosonic acid transferase [Flavobacteriales bacterium]|nr:hypothetical protein [Flavobacteriales bacterium]MCB9165863.1 3-deoxy-D-manno-octulosonic acid transferase [Flavobacteriales bacterium]